jgi:hypothetical protein
MFRFEIRDNLYLKIFNKKDAEELHELIELNKDYLKEMVELGR